MMHPIKQRICVLLTCSLLSFGAFADGTITDGGASLFIGDATSNGFFASTTGIGSSDQFWSFGYWYRLPGDTAETRLDVPDVANYVGNEAWFYWFGVGGVFDLTLTVILQENSLISHDIDYEMVVTNLTDITQTFDLFFLTDPDLQASIGADVGELINANDTFEVSDVDDPITYTVYGQGADNYQVGNFPSIANILNDAAVDDFNNTGLPFGPGDITGGLQWVDESVAGFFSDRLVYTHTSLESPVPPLPVPGPGRTALLILLALMSGVAVLRLRLTA